MVSKSRPTPASWLYTHTHTHLVYIYIVIHRQTFVLSELFSVARHAGRSKPESKPVQLYDRLSFRPLGHKRTTLATGIFLGILYFSKQQQPLFMFFHTLSVTRELNSFEEPCITLMVADNSFARELNPHGEHIYIYTHTHTLFMPTYTHVQIHIPKVGKTGYCLKRVEQYIPGSLKCFKC